MVRNVNRRGFSVVEIMISMVILSIVVMIMSHILIATSRGQSKANSDDEGDAIALEYLAKIQNKVINTGYSSTGVSEPYPKDSKFNVHWKIEAAGSGLPSKATVTVTWTTSAGQQTSQIVGYVDLKNECGAIVPNANGITDLTYSTRSGTGTANAPDAWASATTSLATAPQIALDKTTGFQVVKVVPTGLVSGDMKATYTILTSQDRFTIDAQGIIKTARAFTSKDVGTHKLKLQVFDCSGANKTLQNIETIEIKINADAGVPDVKDSTFAPICDEYATNTINNSVNPKTLGTIRAINPNQEITWEPTDARFTITSSGTNKQDAEIVLNGDADSLLNFEKSGGVITVPVVAYYTTTPTKKVNVTIKFPINDVPEKPTGVFLNTINNNVLTVSRNIPVGTSVAKIFVKDEDVVTPDYEVTVNAPGLSYFSAIELSDGSWDMIAKDLSGAPNTIPVFTISVMDKAMDFTKNSSDLTVTVNTTAISNCLGLQWTPALASKPVGEYAYWNNRQYQLSKPILAGMPIANNQPQLIPNYWTDLGGCTQP